MYDFTSGSQAGGCDPDGIHENHMGESFSHTTFLLVYDCIPTSFGRNFLLPPLGMNVGMDICVGRGASRTSPVKVVAAVAVVAVAAAAAVVVVAVAVAVAVLANDKFIWKQNTSYGSCPSVFACFELELNIEV